MWGLLASGLFILFFGATLGSSLIKHSWDAQIAAAIVSAPTSALLLNLARPLLEALGEYGSLKREVAVWATIFISGSIQYFLIGFLLARIVAGSPANENNH
jgi:hypothetical protein